MLALLVANRGNVAERVGRSTLALRVLRRGRLVTTVRPRPRDLLPGSRGLVEFALPRRLRGRVRAVVAAPRLPVRGRSYQVSL
jgi:hypothetical protein